ncbi:hypothetical protein Q3C01_08855 [Bradyrhizobium sp. UFLA05-109]
MSDTEGAATKALTSIIDALTPLSSEERHRTVNAAMMFLGETVAPKRKLAAGGDAAEEYYDDADGDHPAHRSKWMKQNSVSAEELDQVFHFGSDGAFDLLNAPGRSKKEQTLNTYILTGLGKYLSSSGDRTFDDATARQFCETIGCYDQANHAAHLKNRGPEFTGDKNKGYALTNPGVKRGAVLVKEVAGASA